MLEIEHQNTIGERKRRSDILHQLSDKKTRAFYRSQTGLTYPVLWESRSHGEQMMGFTSNYVKVAAPMDKAKVNTLEEITITDQNLVFE